MHSRALASAIGFVSSGERAFSVDPPYWCRAALITANAIPNSILARAETAIYRRAIAKAQIEQPLVILGCWRSGTTHLQNLLSLDSRFAYPTFFQCLFPHTFLLTERWLGQIYRHIVPPKRPQDNMLMHVATPQEDEFALAASGVSFLLSMAFPRQSSDYDRLLTLSNATDPELREWKAALLTFLKKLTIRNGGRPLILKSLGHTARIRLFLEMFPDARFVHIRRNPYDVFVSALHTVKKVAPWWVLQRQSFDDLDSRVIEQYRELYDAYFEELPLIAAGPFCEVAFEDLERDPLTVLRKIYQQLQLPEFSIVEPQVRDYIESLRGYCKNEFSPLPTEMKSRVAREWHRCFETRGYPTAI